MTLLGWLAVLTGGMVGAAMLLFSIASSREGEKRAARVALGLAVVLPLPYLAIGLLRFPFQPAAASALVAATALFLLVAILPLGRPGLEGECPRTRIDERDIMFARWRLSPGSQQYNEYYARRPEKRDVDDRIRQAPGLLARGSRMYHRFAFPAAEASFDVVETLRRGVERPIAIERTVTAPAGISRFIKGVAGHYGAWSVGITRLRDYHVYTHVGRGRGHYGSPVVLNHQYAIAFTVEMSHSMVRQSPAAATIIESSKQYLAAAAIALQLTNLIRCLGYDARAHIDGDYRVICPLVARDAGLGEIGRMGLLMDRRLGPRVRIAVVTTDLPLIPDRPARDPSVLDFCRRCRKCAENCPSRAIPFGDAQLIDGVKRWRINDATCFFYWVTIGTDCGRCLAVCPYSHPDTFPHGLTRWAISHSTPARWLALQLDNVFYGRRPAPAEWPVWLQDSVEKPT